MIRPICRDCQYFWPVYMELSPNYYGCQHPNLTVDSPVHGKYIQHEEAEKVRADPTKCGPEGKWFEPKHPKTVKEQLFGWLR